MGVEGFIVCLNVEDPDVYKAMSEQERDEVGWIVMPPEGYKVLLQQDGTELVVDIPHESPLATKLIALDMAAYIKDE